MQVIWGSKKSTNKLKGRERMEKKELVKYFSKDLFVPDLHATTKEESLRELANLFVKSKFIRNKRLFLEMLHKRESLGSTGIGKGVAIPHGRTTAALDVKIAFGKSSTGIEFDAIDKKPVHLIFMVIAPPHDENNRYLPILGKLVELLNDSNNRKKFLKVQTYEEFINIFVGIEC
jgi:mannitol/fructose-specific phosphotransferase system IIA component (Ntr-type)